jgi:Tfp pilus assembly major pilin PilA
MTLQTKPSKYPWLLTWGRWAVYLLIFGLFLLVSLSKIDPDFGWHLREGQDFLNGVFPPSDIYNFNAADYSWAAHEWLSDILMAFLYNSGGYELVAVVWGLIFVGGFWLAGKGKFGPVILAAFMTAWPFIGVRTVVFAVFGLGLLLWLMSHNFKRPRLKLILISLIIFIWAQLHGSFLIGIVYLLYRAVLVDKSYKIALATLIGALATIINPFGYHLWLETLAIIFDSELTWHISEWSIGINFWTITPLFMLWMAGFILNPPSKLGLKKSRWKHWLYFARFDILMFFSSFKAIRNYPLFALTAIKPAHDSLAQFNQISHSTKPALIFGRIIYGVFVAGLFFVVAHHALPYVENMIKTNQVVSATSSDNGYPNRIISHIKQQPCAGNLFNHYNIGGYLIWQLPEEKVYIDGRMGTTWTRPNGSTLGEAGENYYATWELIDSGERKPSDIWKELMGVTEQDPYEYTDRAKAKQQQVFEQFNITCAIVKQKSKIYQHLLDQEWSVVLEDDNSWYLLEKAV